MTNYNYVEISSERAMQLGLMMASFKDCQVYPVSFNATEYSANCFGYNCSLIIYDKDGCFYREKLSDE